MVNRRPKPAGTIGGSLEIEHDAPFTMVRREKQRTHILVPHRTDASHVVALRTLDLDHVCTHLGQNLSGEGPHAGRSTVAPNTVQRSPSLNGGRHNRKRELEGTWVSGRINLGGLRVLKKKTQTN